MKLNKCIHSEKNRDAVLYGNIILVMQCVKNLKV